MTTDGLKALYDHKYRNERWAPLVLRPDAWSTNRLDDTARLLRTEKGGALLELGCGGGQFIAAVGKPFDRIVGIDLSDVRIETARAALREYDPALAERTEFIAGSADDPLRFPDQSFDVVIACAVIEHVVDLFGALDEIRRVCKPGGCLIMTVPNLAYLKHVMGLLFGRIPLTGSPTRDIRYWREHGWDGGHLHYFTRQALSELLSNSGFRPEHWTGDGRWARLRRWSQSLVGNLTVRARRA